MVYLTFPVLCSSWMLLVNEVVVIFYVESFFFMFKMIS